MRKELKNVIGIGRESQTLVLGISIRSISHLGHFQVQYHGANKWFHDEKDIYFKFKYVTNHRIKNEYFMFHGRQKAKSNMESDSFDRPEGMTWFL